MVNVSIIPTHDLAAWLLTHIDALLDWLGLEKHQALEQIIYFIIIVAASLFIGWIIKKVILLVTRKLVRLRNTAAGQALLQQHTLTKCSHIIPPLVFLSLAPFAFDAKSETLTIITRVAVAYATLCIGYGASAVLTFIFTRYNEKENTRNLPIKGVLNIAVGLVWAVVIIIGVSVIVDKSPAALLGGLTAFAAALMLIFKDSILGFVAGLQMSNNDMVRVGDWIVVPSTLANGIVEDVSLTTVKVRNFDNTLVMVPPYTIVSTCVQNWRGMSESGVRRVAQSIYVNPDTVCRPASDKLDALAAKYADLKPFIDKLRSSDKLIEWQPGVAPLNGTIETNLGLFRAYIMTYLLASPMVSSKHDMMVKIDSMSPEGVPVQLYFFSVTTQWQQYEAVRSAIMEHALAAAADFDLEILSADHLNVTTESEK